MRKRFFIVLVCVAYTLTVALPAFAAEDVQGLWKIIDDKTKEARGFVVLYLHEGRLYGRMVATIDEKTRAWISSIGWKTRARNGEDRSWTRNPGTSTTAGFGWKETGSWSGDR